MLAFGFLNTFHMNKYTQTVFNGTLQKRLAQLNQNKITQQLHRSSSLRNLQICS